MLAIYQPKLAEVKVNWNHPLNKGLVSCYLFNEGIGTKVSDLKLTPKNVASFHTSMGQRNWLISPHGRAIDFDGVDDEILTPNDPIKQGNITVSARIKVRTFGAEGWAHFISNGAFSFAVSSAFGNSFYVTSDRGNNAASTNGSFTPNLNQWYHVCVTRDTAGNCKIYVNGTQKGGVGATGTPTLFGNLLFGRRGGGTEYFDGAISDVRIYNRILIPYEIKQLTNTPYVPFIKVRQQSFGLASAAAVEVVRRRRIIISH